MHLEPLGDQAVMAYCNDEAEATLLATRVRRARPTWCIDVVQAYVSVAIYYDLAATTFDDAVIWLTALTDNAHGVETAAGRLHVIPCCYEVGLDFERISQHTSLNRDDIIAAHLSQTYTIYAIGFCPGFPYLGYLPESLAGVPRLESPRLQVERGSVGLTGRQTGIYTEPRPGGWNIVGRTPLLLVDVESEYFPLRTGDHVQFRRINKNEFRKLNGQRLVCAPTGDS